MHELSSVRPLVALLNWTFDYTVREEHAILTDTKIVL